MKITRKSKVAVASFILLGFFSFQILAAPFLVSSSDSACKECAQACESESAKAPKDQHDHSENCGCACHQVVLLSVMPVFLEMVFSPSLRSDVCFLDERPSDPLVRLIYLPPRLG